MSINRRQFLAASACTSALSACTSVKPLKVRPTRFKPMSIPGLEARPDFWRVRPDEMIAGCESVKKGRAEVIAHTPLGYPVHAVFYGDFSEPPPQSNWSAGSASTSWKSYYGEQEHKQTILLIAGVHGAEPESGAGALNLIRMLETGQDYRGKTDPELIELASRYRLIIVPCVNMDGRALSPDHLRNVDHHTFRIASQGAWLDGSQSTETDAANRKNPTQPSLGHSQCCDSRRGQQSRRKYEQSHQNGESPGQRLQKQATVPEYDLLPSGWAKPLSSRNQSLIHPP